MGESHVIKILKSGSIPTNLKAHSLSNTILF